MKSIIKATQDALFSFKSKRKLHRIRILAFEADAEELTRRRVFGGYISKECYADEDRQEGDGLMKNILFFVYKKYTRWFIKIQIWTLMEMDCPMMLFILFRTSTVYLLGVNGTVSRDFYLKYLKLCSEDERSFYGVGNDMRVMWIWQFQHNWCRNKLIYILDGLRGE